MEEICSFLGIEKGVHIYNNLYGYPNHWSVYKMILKLSASENVQHRNSIIEQLKTKHLRDLQSKMGSKGRIGVKVQMISGIIEKCNEFNRNFQKSWIYPHEYDEICVEDIVARFESDDEFEMDDDEEFKVDDEEFEVDDDEEFEMDDDEEFEVDDDEGFEMDDNEEFEVDDDEEFEMNDDEIFFLKKKNEFDSLSSMNVLF